MKQFIIGAALLLLAGCAEKTTEAIVTAKDGTSAASCVIANQPGGALVTCPGGESVFIRNGSNGSDGSDGLNGVDGESCKAKEAKGGIELLCPGSDVVYIPFGNDDIAPGLLCNVHNLANWNGVTNILSVLSASAPVGSFILPNLSVGNSPSSGGFPGMPSSLQSIVGLDGYALDCTGYIDIPTSGMYTFSMLNDDGVRLVIDEKIVISSPALQAPTTNTSLSVEMHKGRRSFNVIYYQGPHTQIALRLQWSGPHTPLAVVPSSAFSH
jgi:hypothetical protein